MHDTSAQAGGRATDRCVRIRVEGRVQGVGFRFFALQVATGLGLRGFVRNLPDGRVEAEAAGDPAVLRRFISDLRRGPSSSRVDRCVTEWIEGRDTCDSCDGFDVRH